MKVYIAGQITGIESYKDKFKEVAAKIKDAGAIPINPAMLPFGMNDKDYMPICLSMLEKADAIYLMDGWKESKGARLEAAFADYQGKLIFYESEDK